MTILGHINDREIIHIEYDLEKAWYKDLPSNSWLLLTISDHKDINIFSEINRRAIDNNVVYVCAIGKECEAFHDTFDEDISIREVENQYLPTHHIMTTWHDDFDEGFFFAIAAAFGDGKEINKVVCLDLAGLETKSRLIKLINEIQKK